MASAVPVGAAGARTPRRRRLGPRVKLRYSRALRQLGCFATGNAAGEGGAFVDDAESTGPPHLIVTVNGIVGSASNWRFAAKEFVDRHRNDVIVHCSNCNAAIRTLHGVDVMGRRLADEVINVVSRRPYLEKISFVAHSLGGLVARYAIALLYEKDTTEDSSKNASVQNRGDSIVCPFEKGKVAGLEPVNFVTFATPHLGSRFHKQLPILGGNNKLEKTAYHLCRIAGRSGQQLFLKDRPDGRPPLLLQMATDFNGLNFMSALSSFRRRVVYSNIKHDFFVGFKTSSIRQELPRLEDIKGDGDYPHVIHVETTEEHQREEFSEALISCTETATELEAAMLKGLNRVSWERVDVSFRKSVQRIFAHSTIQVKNRFFHSAGVDVIRHLIDTFTYN